MSGRLARRPLLRRCMTRFHGDFMDFFLATLQPPNNPPKRADLLAKRPLHPHPRLLRLLRGQLGTRHLATSNGGLAADSSGGAAILVAATRTARLAALGIHPLLGGPTLEVRPSLRLADVPPRLAALGSGLSRTG